MAETANPTALLCTHCGAFAGKNPILQEDAAFCCVGCQTVYGILHQNGLCNYYEIAPSPGLKFEESNSNYSVYELDLMAENFTVFTKENLVSVILHIPSMHCSSCIWLLERAGKLDNSIVSSRVNFIKKQVKIEYDNSGTSFGKIVLLLKSIGYEPSLLPEEDNTLQEKQNRNVLLKLGIAGFCAGNIMMFSFPQYLGLSISAESNLYRLFNALNILLSIPLIFYCASEYFIAFYHWLRHRVISVKVPLALGIGALWLRSIYEISTASGPGYWDSLAGLIFFLLAGAWLQNRTFDALRFGEKTKKFFPLIARVLINGQVLPKKVVELDLGDRLLIAHGEVVAADGILMSSHASVDYAFVSGESTPVHKVAGEIIFAGGKNSGESFEMEIIKRFNTSQMADIWNTKVDESPNKVQFETIISKYFIFATILLASVSLIIWLPTYTNKAWLAFTAVLMVACPCALALAPPFTYNIVSTFFAKKGIYLKNPEIVAALGETKNIVFDKTGTLTQGNNHKALIPKGYTVEMRTFLKSLASQSLHPVSVSIVVALNQADTLTVSDFTEQPGLGIAANVAGKYVKLGSAKWVLNTTEYTENKYVYFSIMGVVTEPITIENDFNPEMISSVNGLNELGLDLIMATGDDVSQSAVVNKVFPGQFKALYFEQNPQQKYAIVQALKSQAKTVMIGDGLNDALALKAANAGLVVAQNAYNFTPEASGILLQKDVGNLPLLFRISKAANNIVKETFVVSLVYNIVAISMAMAGKMSPLFAAITMPASAIILMLYASARAKWLVHRKENS